MSPSSLHCCPLVNANFFFFQAPHIFVFSCLHFGVVFFTCIVFFVVVACCGHFCVLFVVAANYFFIFTYCL
jgi:hypothetical protein